MNPQIQVVLNEPDTVVVSLNQHSTMDPKVIGFSSYKMPKALLEVAPPILFKRIKSAVNSQYTNSRQVSHRYIFHFLTIKAKTKTVEVITDYVNDLRISRNRYVHAKLVKC